MEISSVYIFNTTTPKQHNDMISAQYVCSVRKDQQQIAIADISYLVVSLQR